MKTKQLFFVILSIFFLYLDHDPILHAQEVDLDLFLTDTNFVGVTNLGNAINSGLNSSTIQVIHTQGPFKINLSYNLVRVGIADEKKIGPLAKTSGFGIPFGQVEIGLPKRISMLLRGSIFNLGDSNQKKATLWGVGVRYQMLEETPNVGAGIVVLYEGIGRLEDFDLQTLLIQGYFGYIVSKVNFYVAPSFSRNLFNIHLNNLKQQTQLYRNNQDTKITSFVKFTGGAHFYLTKRITLAGNIVFGEYFTIGIGANINLF